MIVMILVELLHVVKDRLLLAQVLIDDLDNYFDRFVSPNELPFMVAMHCYLILGTSIIS